MRNFDRKPRRPLRGLALSLVIASSLGACSSEGSDPAEPVEVDWTETPGGDSPDDDHSIMILADSWSDRVEISVGVSPVAYDRLDSLDCVGADGGSLEGSGADEEAVWRIDTFTQYTTGPIGMDCEAVFEGRTVEFGVQWPNVERNDAGEIDFDNSDLSRCEVAGSGAPPTKTDVTPGSRLIECGTYAAVAEITPGDYYLGYPGLVVYP